MTCCDETLVQVDTMKIILYTFRDWATDAHGAKAPPSLLVSELYPRKGPCLCVFDRHAAGYLDIAVAATHRPLPCGLK
jgi:hypothetical protein